MPTPTIVSSVGVRTLIGGGSLGAAVAPEQHWACSYGITSGVPELVSGISST